MIVRIDPLYHWSPAARRKDIVAHGLRPGAPATIASGSLPYVCFGPSPARAWSLSAAMEWAQEIEDWDLWQARLADGDDVRIRPDFGPNVQEIKIYGPVPADRLWYAGTRRVDGIREWTPR